jgi:tail fiber protein|nr:MAG TPA: structural protein [Caudoviricetes sp.]
MAKIWRSRDIIGAEDAQRWENKADATHRHRVSDIDGLEAIIGNQTTNKANQADLTGHINNRNNPHGVTKAQVGLGNVTNVEQASKSDFQHHLDNHNNPHSVTKAQVGLENVTNVEQASKQEFNAHTTNHNNPHSVTKQQVGLGNVDNIKQASYESVEALKREFQEHEDRLNAIEYMFLQNDFTAPIRTEDGTEHTLLADENGYVIVADWKYRMEV